MSWMDGWMDEWIDNGLMDGWIHSRTCESDKHLLFSESSRIST